MIGVGILFETTLAGFLTRTSTSLPARSLRVLMIASERDQKDVVWDKPTWISTKTLSERRAHPSRLDCIESHGSSRLMCCSWTLEKKCRRCYRYVLVSSVELKMLMSYREEVVDWNRI